MFPANVGPLSLSLSLSMYMCYLQIHYHEKLLAAFATSQTNFLTAGGHAGNVAR